MKKNSLYEAKDHTFVICAYQESRYLESCLRSLFAQTVRSHILIATSTPNAYIDKIAQKYAVQVFTRKGGEKGIAADWNFALSCASTPLVTLAHQDDLYDKHYTRAMLAELNQRSKPMIAFSDYAEKRKDQIVTSNRLLRIKRLLLMPLITKKGQVSVFWRRMALSLGNPICCPSVTYVLPNLPQPIFQNNMESNVDWQAWEYISKQQGSFVYLPRILVLHRIHEDSTTSHLIQKDGRVEEDLRVLRSFWPRWAADVLERFYRHSEDSNDVK